MLGCLVPRMIEQHRWSGLGLQRRSASKALGLRSSARMRWSLEKKAPPGRGVGGDGFIDEPGGCEIEGRRHSEVFSGEIRKRPQQHFAIAPERR